MKTYSLKKEEVERSWFILDVSDRILGRVATKIADKIRGKDKPTSRCKTIHSMLAIMIIKPVIPSVAFIT